MDRRETSVAALTSTALPTTFLAETSPEALARRTLEPEVFPHTTLPSSLEALTVTPLTDPKSTSPRARASKLASTSEATETRPRGARARTEQYRSG